MTYYLPSEIIAKLSHFSCAIRPLRTADLGDDAKNYWIERYKSGSIMFGQMVCQIFLADLSIETSTIKTTIHLVSLCRVVADPLKRQLGTNFDGEKISRLTELLQLQKHIMENLGDFDICLKYDEKIASHDKHLVLYRQGSGLIIQTHTEYSLLNECIITQRDQILQVVNMLISYTQSAKKLVEELRAQLQPKDEGYYRS